MMATLPELLRRRAESEPDAVFLEEVGGRTFSNAEFYRESLRFADALSRVGIVAGDHVAAMLEQCGRSHLLWLGSVWLGAVEVPMNTELRGATLVHVLNNSGAKVLITTPTMLPRIADVRAQLTSLETVVLAEGNTGEWGGTTVGIDDLLESGEPTVRSAPKEYDTYGVIFTSGTTGLSKGVVCSWALAHQAVQPQFRGDKVGDYPDGAVYVPWPVFHRTGKGGLIIAAELGLRVVVRERFSVSAFWDDIRKYRCTHVNLLGFGAVLLNQPARPDDADNPLRRALMLPVPTRYREFEARFGVRISTIWGMSEIGLPISTDNPKNSTACGQLGPEYEARIVDEHDYEVPDGEPGEFIIRSHRPWLLMTEYLGQPEATARAWRNGWFHTGDILRRDSEGDYYFIDRSSDYVRRRGHNISSLEVEAAVTAHPEVVACACIGVPSAIAALDDADPAGLEHAEVAKDLDVKVVVERAPESRLTEEALVQYLIENMPRFMVPRFVEFVSEMPRTPTMKVRKAELRKLPLTATTWDREAAGIQLPPPGR